MRRLLIAFLICPLHFALLAGSPAVAAPATAASPQSQGIHTLQHLETLSYKAATAFYLYSVLNRDPQQYKKMQSLLGTGDAVVQQVGRSNVATQWGMLKRRLTTATFTEEGVADNASINAIDAALNTLTQTLRTLSTEERAANNVAPDKMADMLYDQYVLMQVMTSAYLRKSADYFGGAIVASQGPQVEIDQLAHKFSSQLEQLSRHYQRNAQISATLKEITTKWVFVRNSFINFNQDNVPFIVGRYNEQITDKLLEAYEKLRP